MKWFKPLLVDPGTLASHGWLVIKLRRGETVGQVLRYIGTMRREVTEEGGDIGGA